MTGENRSSLLLLSSFAVGTLLVILFWRQLKFSVSLLLLWGIIVWGTSFAILGRQGILTHGNFKWIWTIKGAIAYFSGTLFALGIVYIAKDLSGHAPSNQTLLQEFMGFSLAYAISFILVYIYRIIQT